ncbi:capsanthin/capsorubin synthase, chromoplastic-like [Phoenix dactylifera]|uniref:Capsanthin/capsorubin synthase, chromoplastic-like n=1 Tax=Phoenix dactylifera TaxID=42345 RepID=A0A8B8ZYX1_PHODC|nr:capsanthin/capsorubin synthase, chromoplastic-like [Phoenix dactylifera]
MGSSSMYKAKAWKVEHKEFNSVVTCSNDSELKASMVVDATGFTSPFIEFEGPVRNLGYQIAHGILAEVEGQRFDADKMVLMDWRDSHLGNEPCLRHRNDKLPTFLYAMPFDSDAPNLFLAWTGVAFMH